MSKAKRKKVEKRAAPVSVPGSVKIKQLAEEKFNGNQRKAIEYIFSDEFDTSERVKILNDYTDCTPRQRLLLFREMDKKSGYPGGTGQYVMDQMQQKELKMTTDEIKELDLTPYKKAIGNSLLLLVAGIAVLIGSIVLFRNMEVGSSLVKELFSLLIGLIFAYLLGNCVISIRSYFEWKKMKTRYNHPEAQEKLEAADQKRQAYKLKRKTRRYGRP